MDPQAKQCYMAMGKANVNSGQNANSIMATVNYDLLHLQNMCMLVSTEVSIEVQNADSCFCIKTGRNKNQQEITPHSSYKLHRIYLLQLAYSITS